MPDLPTSNTGGCIRTPHAQAIASLNAKGIEFATSSFTMPNGITDKAELINTIANEFRPTLTRTED